MTGYDAGSQEWLGTTEMLARMPRITSREGLAALRRKGMPCRKTTKGHEYPWPAAGAWYLDQVEAAARGEKAPDFEDARARKTAAEADLAELELARARGEVLEVADVASEVERMLDGLRSAVLAVRGKWAPHLIGVATMPAASALLDRMTSELLETLSGDDDAGG